MNTFTVSFAKLIKLFLTTAFAISIISACEGDDGLIGPQGPSAAQISNSATSLTLTIDSVTIDNGTPVVTLSAVNEDNLPFAGIKQGDLRFAFAKLVPGTNGDSSYWQSYINRSETATVGPGTGNSAIQATTESNGTLVNNDDGTYTYTFANDVSNITTPLAVTYDATLTHRVAIQIGGGLPVSNPIYDFRPSDGATSGLMSREIVKIDSCNSCHNKLAMHGGGRVDTKYCVTCHNPGSTDANSGNTVDFKVMVHKIHRGENLPSVVAGGEYSIYGFRNSKHDYSTVVHPQDVRNCTKCHDGSDPDTPQGDNWKTQLSAQTCGSCHDDVDFAAGTGHAGGAQADNTACSTCHTTGGLAKSPEEAHDLAEKTARSTFQYNIIEICGTAVGSNPICAPNTAPTIKISVTDPTNGDTAYDLAADPEFTSASASLNVLIAWDTKDYNNDGGAGSRPARANSINVKTAAPTDNGDGTFTVTSPNVVPATATGSGAIALEGHPAADLDGDTVFSDRVAAKGVVAYFGITDTTPVARRTVVDNAKCNQCHDQLNLHGSNRNGEVALCVMCHNPNNTDVGRRPTNGAGGLDDTVTVDSKREETIDFKVLIHAIHAGAKTNFDGTDGHGIRERGIVNYGFGGSAHDYSHVRYPGIINDCDTCHLSGTYKLDGNWAQPTQNGILSTTTDAAPTSTDTASVTAENTDQTDDLNISPTAAVCSSCHDSDLAKAHMVNPGGAVFGSTQTTIDAAAIETCAVCHGPGRDTDVEKVHAQN